MIARAGKPAHKKKSCTKPPSNAKLDQMIEEAIVDADGESEQMTWFYAIPGRSSAAMGLFVVWSEIPRGARGNRSMD